MGAILLTASVSGYFMGLRQTGSQISMTRPVSLAKADPDRREMLESRTVPVAVAYAKQDWLAEGPNAAWRNHLAHLVQPPVDPAMLTNVTPAERAQALAERAGRRAFDGAPPVVPHPITQDSSAACLACHGPGLAVKDKVASKISHAHYASCTQCHVPAGGPQIPTLDAALLAPLAGNEFTYAAWPRQGGRPWPGAP
ncbi:MAG TPA: nitrate reductase cytochrome c-type subunit, partial [Methylomirabilota bacterium]|nr:nitrate reductase cytochrome c-type subunit [Methylomirabilota bacterium]